MEEIKKLEEIKRDTFSSLEELNPYMHNGGTTVVIELKSPT